MVNKSLFSSNSNEWSTPIELFNQLDKVFNFDLDPCSSENRILKEDILIYTKEINGLNKSWKDRTVFVNPPYSNIKIWAKKCYDEWKNNAKIIVLLIPSRTDTKYFHKYIYHYAKLRFIKGRLKFIDHNGNILKNCAPFPSMLCFYINDKDKYNNYREMIEKMKKKVREK